MKNKQKKTYKTRANFLWVCDRSEFIALLYQAAMQMGAWGKLPALWSLLLIHLLCFWHRVRWEYLLFI